MKSEITAKLRVRISQSEAHYGSDLVDGARILRLFGDIITEVAIRTDGHEGLFVGYEEIEFVNPVYAGDFIEATGRLTRVGRTSREVEFEARKVVAARYDVAPNACDALDEPIVVIRAKGTTVVPSEHSRSTPSSSTSVAGAAD